MRPIKKIGIAAGLAVAILAGFRLAEFHSPKSSGPASSDYFGDPKVAELASAAEKGDISKIGALIKSGVDVNSHGKGELTVLAWAMLKQNKAAFEHLLALGADPNLKASGIPDQGQTLLSLAAGTRDIYWLSKLLQHGGDPNQKTASADRSPIFHSILHGLTAHSIQLLDKGADPNYKDISGMTAMLYAAEIHQFPAVLAMLEHSGDWKQKTKYGKGIRDFAATYRGTISSDKTSAIWEAQEKVVAAINRKEAEMSREQRSKADEVPASK